MLSCWESWGWDHTSHGPVLALQLRAPSSSLRPLPGRNVTSWLPVALPRRRGDTGESVPRQLLQWGGQGCCSKQGCGSLGTVLPSPGAVGTLQGAPGVLGGSQGRISPWSCVGCGNCSHRLVWVGSSSWKGWAGMARGEAAGPPWGRSIYH